MKQNRTKQANTYARAGVDLDTGDDASRIMFEASKKTWANRKGLYGEVCLPLDSFAGVRYVQVSRFDDAILGMNFDGIGTKIEVAERMSDHTTMAHDLFAMVCDDAARNGGEPLMVGSILDFKQISTQVVQQLANGMVQAAELGRVAVVNGEIAELGNRVSGFGNTPYNWGASAVWIARIDRLIGGSKIVAGNSIVAVREEGFRSNGLSLVRKVLSEAYGSEWHNQKLGNSKIGRAVLHPSRIYTRLMVALTGGYDAEPKARVNGFVNVTGGGIPGKLSRLLQAVKLGALIENPFEPCQAMLHCQAIGGIQDGEAYRAWNMGNGLLIITPEPDIVLAECASQGYNAKVIGAIDGKPEIKLKSRGLHANKEPWLTFKC